MGDRPSERSGRRTLPVDMDPLVVIGRVREEVYTVLIDYSPVGIAEMLSYVLLDVVDTADDEGHGVRWYSNWGYADRIGVGRLTGGK
jgi:hypothetical protein